MSSSTYQDIIDDKVTAWQNRLKRLEDHADKASSGTRAELKEKLGRLRSKIERAEVQLRTLDEQEKAENTIEIKDKILQVFGSIDKEFPLYEEQTPYML